MTEQEMREWINAASYEQLLAKWRFEPVGSPWFQGRVGRHFEKVMAMRRAGTPFEERIAISKRLRFGRGEWSQ